MNNTFDNLTFWTFLTVLDSVFLDFLDIPHFRHFTFWTVLDIFGHYFFEIQSSKVTAKASRASLNVIWRAREQQGPQSKEICYLQQ
jgi:hypothetical protein